MERTEAGVRTYVVYDFEGKAPRSLYRWRNRLESSGLARWIQYSVVETDRFDVALDVARFCHERGAKVNLIQGIRLVLGDGLGERSPLGRRVLARDVQFADPTSDPNKNSGERSPPGRVNL